MTVLANTKIVIPNYIFILTHLIEQIIYY